ncbi:MAG: CPBP family intramembrane metalloprotease [Chitinophagaceae bacterium]|nr:CPBP family intramembrane metalloprotease [Chitinophagaceae bacterium]
MFRAPLNNSKKTLITSSLALFFLLFFSNRIFQFELVYLCVFAALLSLNTATLKNEYNIRFNQAGCIYSSFLFALFHLSNYFPITHNKIALLPFALFPLFLIGMVLSVIRIEKGVLYSIFFHILFNNISILFRYL